MADKKKLTTAVVAGATALALVLGGTFAWTSISQQARNEAVVDINPGGRLHDDFNGANKDVYVENFGDTTTGVPIYARIRLDEYLEIGQDAGIKTVADGETRRAVSIIDGSADINDPTTWTTYIPSVDEIDGTLSAGAAYWTWALGNDSTDGRYYMPTFNKNKDSLKADINGTYEGTVAGDIVHYDDYRVYGDSQTVTADAEYDFDDDTVDEENPSVRDDVNDPWDDHDVYHESETHTAQQISTTASVITMKQWIEDYDSQPGAYWVYDTDGWAYWAQAIAPGETTGMLLDGISMSKVPDDSWYYGINVVGQFVTASDLSAFSMDGQTMTSEAEDLLAAITDAETFALEGSDSVAAGYSKTYSVVRYVAGVQAGNQPTGLTWTAKDTDGNDITGVSISDGVLTVADTVADGTSIVINATDGGDIDISRTVTVKVLAPLSVSVSEADENVVLSGQTTDGVVWFTYMVDNEEGEVVEVKLNREIDLDATLADQATSVSEGVSVVLKEGTTDTLVVTFSGSAIGGSLPNVNGLPYRDVRLCVTTDAEKCIVDFLVAHTQDDSMTVYYVRGDAEAAELTSEVTLQAGDLLKVGENGVIAANAVVFYDADGNQLSTYSYDRSSGLTVSSSEEAEVTIRVIGAPDGTYGNYTYRDIAVKIAGSSSGE